MNKHIGSTLESLFDEAGEREEFEALVMKKMIVDQIREGMARRRVTAPKLATEMKTSRAAVRRLLDPKNTGLTLDTLVRAASILGLALSLDRRTARVRSKSKSHSYAGTAGVHSRREIPRPRSYSRTA